MTRLFKGLLYLLLTVIVLLILAGAALVIFVDPNHYRAAIATQVERVTGRPFAIEGKLHWTVFPWLGIAADKVQLGNPPGFGADNFLTIQQANLSIAFTPLFHGNIRFGKLTLDGVTVHLIKNAQGEVNWLFVPVPTKGTAVGNGAEEASAASQSSAIAGYLKNKFKLAGMAVSSIDIQHAQLIFDDFTTQQHFIIHDFYLHSSDVGFNKAFPLTMEMTFINKALPRPVLVAWQSQIVLNPQACAIRLPGLVARVDNLTVQGNAHLDLQSAFKANGDVTIPDFDAQALLRNLGKSDLPSNALRQVKATFAFAVTPRQLNIGNLQGRVDDTQLTGNVAVNFKPQQVQFTLNGDQLDLRRYQTEAVAGVGSLSPIASAVAQSANTILPLPLLQRWQAQGQIRLQRLQGSNFLLTRITIPVNLQQGVLRLAPVTGQIYNGQLQTALTINTQTAPLLWNITGSLQNIDVNQLLTSMKKISHLQMTGIGNVQIDTLQMRGNSKQALLSSLNGNMHFMVLNGILHGIDVRYYSELANALANKEQPVYPNTRQTPFEKLQGSVQFSNGIAHNQDLMIMIPHLSVTGKGSANLITQQLSYQLLLQRLTTGSTVKARGPAVPLRLDGNFTNPKIALDWQALLAEQAVQQLQEQVHNKIADLARNQELKQTLQQGLQSLLGRA